MSFLAQFEPPKTPPRPTAPPVAGVTALGQAALARECEAVRYAPEGTRNDTLNRAAFNLIQLVMGGQLDQAHVQDALASAARDAGLPGNEIANTIRSGFRKGAYRARSPQPRPLAAPHSPEQADDEHQATSWAPRDLSAILDGEPEPGPCHLAREDGQHLFYAGKVNGLIGESESGKTWLALLAVAQALQAGQRVLYIDFEDSPAGIINRLKALGVSDLAGLDYIDPDGPLTDHARADLDAALASHPALVIIDGFNAAMTLLGLDLLSNRDATQFAQQLLKPISATGACVVYVDHLPKNTENQGKGGIGAQAKRAMTTGCAIRVDVKTEFGRGLKGVLKLTVDKDRAGHVRGIAVGAKHIGTAILDDTGHQLSVRVEAPETYEPGTWRPTVLIERITELLTRSGPLSRTQIKQGVTGKNEAILHAVDLMVKDGLASQSVGDRGVLVIQLSSSPSPVPTRPLRVPGDGSPPASPRPPTLGGGRGTGDHQGTDPSPVPGDDEPRDWYR